MDLEYIYTVSYNFLYDNPLIALGIIVFLAVLLWKKPWVLFKIIVAVCIFVVVIYLGSLLGEVGNEGIQNKYIMSTETEKAINE